MNARDVSITQASTSDTAVRANADRRRRFTQGKVIPLRGCMTQPNNFPIRKTASVLHAKPKYGRSKHVEEN